MILVMILSGKARAGKDTLFTYLALRGFKRMAFADELKAENRKLFKLTVEHTDGKLKDQPCDKLGGHTPRELLIDFGNMVRKFVPTYWVDVVFNKLKALNPGARIAITDARYPNEIDILKRLPDAMVMTVRIERHSSRDSMVDENTKQSVSETALDSYKDWDFVLPAAENETPQDLEKFADRIMSHVEKVTSRS
jgi:hypothetical protein